VPMFANLVGYWVLGLPLGFTLCFLLKKGIFGLWIGLTLALVVIASALLHRWNKDSAQTAAILLPVRPSQTVD
jgi:MATE family, multidrug efflux pump